MNYIKDTNLKETSNIWNMIVEIPKGTNKKYELIEPKNEKVECVRKVHGKYPFYYGCFPQTLAGDNDPLDAILFTKEKHSILEIVKVQPIGVIKTIDNGEVDDKVLVVPSDEPIEHLDKLEKRTLKFLSKYKGKHSNTIIDSTIYDIQEALTIIYKAHSNYICKNTSTQSNCIKVGF